MPGGIDRLSEIYGLRVIGFGALGVQGLVAFGV